MNQHAYPGRTKRESYLISPELPGGGQHIDKMQEHWVLARAGKKVLRPGGIELTRQMLDALAIGPQDRVVEFAPGLGTPQKWFCRSTLWHIGAWSANRLQSGNCADDLQDPPLRSYRPCRRIRAARCLRERARTMVRHY